MDTQPYRIPGNDWAEYLPGDHNAAFRYLSHAIVSHKHRWKLFRQVKNRFKDFLHTKLGSSYIYIYTADIATAPKTRCVRSLSTIPHLHLLCQQSTVISTTIKNEQLTQPEM